MRCVVVVISWTVAQLHTDGVPLHVQSCSTVQLALHPSLPFALPSSQASLPTRMPSPHFGAHSEGTPPHCQPVSTAQLAEQPSPPSASWSSHASAPSIAPSPHV